MKDFNEVWDECGGCKHSGYAKIRRVLPYLAVVEKADGYALVDLDSGDELDRNEFYQFKEVPKTMPDSSDDASYNDLEARALKIEERIENDEIVSIEDLATVQEFEDLTDLINDWYDAAMIEIEDFSNAFDLGQSVQAYQSAIDLGHSVESEDFRLWLYGHIASVIKRMEDDPVREHFAFF